MVNYLIPYIDPRKVIKHELHEDPMLEEFTYGDVEKRGRILQDKVKKGDFLFFHTSRKGKRVITAYYRVEKIMATDDAKADKFIISKYRNPHLYREELYENDTLVFGNPIYSRILKRPLVLNHDILSKLSNPPRLNPNQAELAAISSALRNWKKLNDNDVKFLLSEIEKKEEEGILKYTFLSSNEVEQLDEVDIENFVATNPNTLGNKIEFFKRQYVLKSGKRVDLLLKDENNLIVVEIKKESIGKDTFKQIKKYLKEVKEEFNCKVRGIIICGDILPIFEDFFIKKVEKDEIDIYLYAWKFNLRPLQLGVEG